jgi:beta-xylosidase
VEAGETPTPSPPPPSSTAVYPDDFPDPFVLHAGTAWYAFSTHHHFAQVPVLRSSDLVHWEARGDALPQLPRWAEFGFVWAPAVQARSTGFVLYDATRVAATGQQCISRAVSVLPEGPYLDASDGPMVCQTDQGGSIDPSPFVMPDGRRWLAWKSEGTLDGEPTRLWSAPLSDDGERLDGPPSLLLQTAESWEGPIIEAPSVAVVDGRLHLFYSGNRWETRDYAVGHAVCDGPAGPCRRTGGPILASGDAAAGPGGAEVFRDLDGSWLLAYHAWDPSAVAYPTGARRLHIDRVDLAGDRPSVAPRRVAPGL